MALAILATLAVVFTLSWAQGFVIPLMLGIIIAYTLDPLVACLEGLRIPRAAGATIVMVCVMGSLAGGAYALRGQVQTIVESLPAAAARVSAEISQARGNRAGDLQTVQNAATAVETAASQAAGAPAGLRHAVTHVIVDQPTFKLDSFLWKSSLGTLGVMGQAGMVLMLAFFLLVGGDRFKRKLVQVIGPSWSRKRIAVDILNDINGSIQKYLILLLATNVLVGLLSWIAFRAVGLENAGAWAATAGVLHIVPYVGPVITGFAVGMAAFMQSGSLAFAVLVAAMSLAIAALIGMLVTTWMAGRLANLNPAVVFIALMFWGWLWGIPGMLLSMPIVVILKVVAQHVRPLSPLSELMGRS